jgi:hypothetical protein
MTWPICRPWKMNTGWNESLSQSSVLLPKPRGDYARVGHLNAGMYLRLAVQQIPVDIKGSGPVWNKTQL